MKFLTKADLSLILDLHIIDQITSEDDTLLVAAEAKAIEEVHQWLSNRYDTNFELREYTPYQVNTTYSDLDRVLVTNSVSNSEFGDTYGMDILSSGVTSGVTDHFVITKKVNQCELPTVLNCKSKGANNLIDYYWLDSTYSPELNNPNMTFSATNVSYSEECGIISYSAATDLSGNPTTVTVEEYNTLVSGGTVTGITVTALTQDFGSKVNEYNTVYSLSSGGTGSTSTLDYNKESLVNGLAPLNFIGDINYFDNYTKENQDFFFTEDRNPVLIDIVASLTVYQLVRRVSPRNMNENIADNFDMAIAKLEQCRSGKITLRLKEVFCAEEKQMGYGVRIGNSINADRNKY